MANTNEVLISLNFQLKGKAAALAAMKQVEQQTAAMQQAYGKLDAINARTGGSFQKVGQILTNDVTYGTNNAGRALKNMKTVWQDVGGQVHQTSAQFVKSSGAWHLMRNGIKVVSGEAAVMGAVHQTMGNQVWNAAKRALVVAPVWMAIRGAMMLTQRTISEVVKANLELETSMADIKTMLTGTTEEIEGQMLSAKDAILQMAMNSRVSLVSLADAFRFLKSANLSFQETMAGFPVVASLMNAFKLSAIEASRAVAGMSNTVGNSLGDNLTIAEKMRKIGDILSYTYVEQDVMVGELIQSYAKFAPVMSMVSNSFTEVITTLGFLNTLMNRGSRAGTEMQSGLILLISKADKLAEAFDVMFDPSKPIDFIKVISEIRNKVGDISEISAEKGLILSNIFGRIGMKAFGLLIANFDTLNEAIGKCEKTSDGYLKKIEEIQMSTVTAQSERFKNIMAATTNQFLSAATATGSYADALKKVNDAYSSQTMQDFSKGTGYVVNQIGNAAAVMMQGIMGPIPTTLNQDQYFRDIETRWNTLSELMKDFKTPEKFFKDQKELIEVSKKQVVAAEQLRKINQDNSDINTSNIKAEEEANKNTYAVMAIQGANELMIASYKLQQLELQDRINMSAKETAEYNLEKEKRISDVVEARLSLIEKANQTSMSLATKYALSKDPKEKKELEEIARLRNLSAIDLERETTWDPEKLALVNKHRNDFAPEQLKLVDEEVLRQNPQFKLEESLFPTISEPTAANLAIEKARAEIQENTGIKTDGTREYTEQELMNMVRKEAGKSAPITSYDNTYYITTTEKMDEKALAAEIIRLQAKREASGEAAKNIKVGS